MSSISGTRQRHTPGLAVACIPSKRSLNVNTVAKTTMYFYSQGYRKGDLRGNSLRNPTTSPTDKMATYSKQRGLGLSAKENFGGRGVFKDCPVPILQHEQSRGAACCACAAKQSNLSQELGGSKLKLRSKKVSLASKLGRPHRVSHRACPTRHE